MKEQLIAYFTGEKQGGVILIVAGILALAAAIALLTARSSYRGMAPPLALLGLLELALGVLLLARVDARVAGLLDLLARAPVELVQAELARMEQVMRSFSLLKIVELLVFAGGVAATYLFRRSDFIFAAGIGCIAQAAFLLMFDLFAERRAAEYLEALRAMSP
ncbi:MAG: hypothetical protein ACRETN_00485 [Nevskiales bacterium]